MALGWSARRQLLYYAVAAVAVAVLLVLVYVGFIMRTPNCFDGAQNGTEHGIDCGGSCLLMCANEALAPTILWSRAFQTAGSYYTLAAYVQNNNVGAGAKDVAYAFQLYDADNLLIVEKRGEIDIPPVQTIPIVAHNVNVGNRVVARTQFCFQFDQHCSASPAPMPVWNKINSRDIPALRTAEQQLAPGGARVDATLINDSLRDARNVTVTAVLFDREGIARAASQTKIDRMPRKSSQPISFTWPQSKPNIVRAELIVLPSF